MIQETYTAFSGTRRLITGAYFDVMQTARSHWEASSEEPLIFADATGQIHGLDLNPAPPPEASPTAASEDAVGRGRPKLGVVPREVTLLPRHWTWLSAQPGGASAALRRLVDQARQDNSALDQRRQAQEAAHRVLSTLAGDLHHYEEVLRALYALDADAMAPLVQTWPSDIQAYVTSFTARALAPLSDAPTGPAAP